MKADLTDVTVQLHHVTEREILVSDDGDREKAVWISLTHCVVETRRDGIAIVTMPASLAAEKGLLT